MMHLLALLLTAYSKVVINTGAGPVDVSDQTVYELPTDRYVCTKDATKDERHVMVSVDCAEKGKPVVSVGAICRTDVEDENVATMLLNVSKTDKPQNVFFMVACRTRQNGINL